MKDNDRVHFLPAGLDPIEAALILGAGLAAGFINVVAGGGTLIAVPALIFLGLPATTANGTVRIAILAQNAAALFRYHRARAVPWDEVRRWVSPVLCGGLLGAWVGTRLSNEAFSLVFGITMLGVAALVVLRPRGPAPAEGASPPRPVPLPVPLLALGAAGFYGGFIQAGSGYLFLAIGTFLLGLPLGRANILKIAFVTSYTPVALLIFAREGQVDLLWGLLLGLGQAVGGWLGAAAALKRGERFIRVVLVGVVVASALKLFLDI